MTLEKVQNYDSIPCWDATDVLLLGKPAGYQSAPLAPVYCRNFGPELTAEADAHLAQKPGIVSRPEMGQQVGAVRRTETCGAAG